jgi:hypothetical protein
VNLSEETCKVRTQEQHKVSENMSFEVVAKFVYLGTTPTDQNSMNETLRAD